MENNPNGMEINTGQRGRGWDRRRRLNYLFEMYTTELRSLVLVNFISK